MKALCEGKFTIPGTSRLTRARIIRMQQIKTVAERRAQTFERCDWKRKRPEDGYAG